MDPQFRNQIAPNPIVNQVIYIYAGSPIRRGVVSGRALKPSRLGIEMQRSGLREAQGWIQGPLPDQWNEEYTMPAFGKQ